MSFRGRIAAGLVLTVALVASATGTADARNTNPTAFTWVSDYNTTPVVTLSGVNDFNSTGGVDKRSLYTDGGAHYDVTFQGQDVTTGFSHVSSYGSAPRSAVCRLQAPESGLASSVGVECRNFAGGRLRHRFSVLTASNAPDGFSDSQLASILVDRPARTTGVGPAAANINTNAGAGANQWRRLSKGRYELSLPTNGALALGATMVTAVAPTTSGSGAYCQPISTAATPPDVSPSAIKVVVLCSTRTGEPIDSRFYATYVSAMNLPGWADLHDAYLVIDRTVPGEYTPAIEYNSQGQPNTATRVSRGVYEFEVPALTGPSGDRKSNLQVASMTAGVRCAIGYWGSRSDGVWAGQVYCLNLAGNATDGKVAVFLTVE